MMLKMVGEQVKILALLHSFDLLKAVGQSTFGLLFHLATKIVL